MSSPTIQALLLGQQALIAQLEREIQTLREGKEKSLLAQVGACEQYIVANYYMGSARVSDKKILNTAVTLGFYDVVENLLKKTVQQQLDEERGQQEWPPLSADD